LKVGEKTPRGAKIVPSPEKGMVVGQRKSPPIEEKKTTSSGRKSQCKQKGGTAGEKYLLNPLRPLLMGGSEVKVKFCPVCKGLISTQGGR